MRKNVASEGQGEIMLVLVINSGSSTLKFDLIDVGDGSNPQSAGSWPSANSGNPQSSRLAHGVVDRIGGDATVEMNAASSGGVERKSVSAPSHKEAVTLALDALMPLAQGGIDAVGHRVVHGGDRFVQPTLIDDKVMRAIEELCDLAPLHNPAALQGITATREALGPDVPMV